jgi:hypothetical protein
MDVNKAYEGIGVSIWIDSSFQTESQYVTKAITITLPTYTYLYIRNVYLLTCILFHWHIHMTRYVKNWGRILSKARLFQRGKNLVLKQLIPSFRFPNCPFKKNRSEPVNLSSATAQLYYRLPKALCRWIFKQPKSSLTNVITDPDPTWFVLTVQEQTARHDCVSKMKSKDGMPDGKF